MSHRAICLAVVTFFAATAFAQITLDITQTPISTTTNRRTLLKADFNHDGRPDLVTWSSDPNFSVFLNDTAGHFTEITTSTPMPVQFLAVADFNKDGFNDVAVCGPTPAASTYTIQLYKGSGNGNFTPLGKPIILANPCIGLTAGDIDGDGNPDLVVVMPTCTGFCEYFKSIAVFKGDGAGNFGPAIVTSSVGGGLNTQNPAADFQGADLADFNRDGFLDLVMGQCCLLDSHFNPIPGGVLIAYGDGTGHFPTNQLFQYLDADGEALVRIADNNSDGFPDFNATSFEFEGPIFFATAWQSQADASSYNIFNLAEETNGGAPGSPFGFVGTPVAPDLNNDGIKDAGIIFTNGTQQSVQTQLGISAGGYTSIQTFLVPSEMDDVVTGDFDGDGRFDLVGIGSDTLTVALNRTPAARCFAPDGGIRLINMCITASSNNLKVQANNNDNWNVKATKIYIDGDPTAAFDTTDDLLTHNFALAPGEHSVTVKMWDQTGPFSSRRIVTVPNAACIPPATDRTVNVCAPVDGASMRETLRVQAAVTDARTVAAVQIYLDGALAFSGKSKQMDQIIDTRLSPGLHKITVKAWDSAGPFSQTVFVRE